MTTSPRLGFTYLVVGQAVPETAVNEALSILEAAAGHFIFLDRDLATPPGSPANGDCYLIASSATGAWAGQDGNIAYCVNGSWLIIVSANGMTAMVLDEGAFIGRLTGTWSVLSSPSGSYQPLDADLTAIAGLTPAQGDILYYNGTAWTRLAAGTSGYFLKTQGAAANPVWASALTSATYAPPVTSSQSGTSYTAVLGDANTFIRFTSASTVTFTIPPNSSVAFPVDTEIHFSQSGAGAVSAAAGAGVTINSRSSDLTLAGQYAVAFVKQVATDTWIMNGDL